MPSASMGIELISEPFLIPVWFYAYSAFVYAVSALIGLLITYYSYKFFRMNKNKTSILLMFGFLFMSMAFIALSLTSVYTYFYKPYFKDNFNIGDLSLVNSLGFSFYYMTATISYLSILMMYVSEDLAKVFKGKLSILYVPLWYLDLTGFHVLSSLILIYVALKNVINFSRKRNLDNFLVMFAFLSIISFHVCLVFVPFDPTIYLAANSLLVVGFSSLLLMLIRVNRSVGERD